MRSLATKHKKFRILPYFLVLPVICAYLLWVYYPFIKSIILSLTVCNTRGEIKRWAGLANFKRFFTTEKSVKILFNTLKLALMLGFGTLTVATILALLCVEKKKFCRVYQTMYALPMAIASVASSTAFKLIFKADGLFNIVTGFKNGWLLNEKTALITVAVCTIWGGIGSSFIFLLVGFRNVPEELIESATIDGAGSMRRIFNILIPCASPQIFFVVFLNINGAFKSYVMIRQLTGGGPNDSTMTLIYDIFLQALRQGRYEIACTESLVLFAMIWVFHRIQFSLENKLVVY